MAGFADFSDENIDRRGSAGMSLQFGIDANPDQAAQSVQLARRYRLPVDLVESDPSEFKRRAKLEDGRAVVDQSPKLQSWLAFSDANAKIAHDDLDNLSGFEQQARLYGELKASAGPRATLSTMWQGLMRAFPQGLESTRQGLRQQYADFMGFEGMAEDARRKSTGVQTDVILNTPEFESSTAQGLYSGGVSLVRQVPGMAASVLLRSSAPMLATAGLQTEAEAYSKYRNRGGAAGESFVGAMGEGATEVATEMLPMKFLVDKFGKVGFGQFLTGYLAKEMPGEQVATFVQDAIDTAVANPDKSWGEFWKERPDAAYQTALATLVQSGVVGGIGSAIGRAGRREQDAKQAEDIAAVLEGMNKFAEASRLRGRDAESASSFFQSVLDDGNDSVFISPDALAQSGLADKIAAAIPAVAEQLESAIVSGHDIRLPIVELMANVAGPELAQSIIPHVSDEPGGFTRTSANEYMQSGQAKELQDLVERTLSEKATDTTFNTSRDAVKSAVLDNLNSVGRFDAQKNEADATLISSYAAVRAAQTGVTPEEFFKKHMLQVRGEVVAGDRFDQASYEKTGDTEADFVTHKGSPNLGEITPEIGASIKRQPGKIRLNVGVQNKDNTGYGLAHIEARHGKEIRAAGFDSVEHFVHEAIRHVDAVWQPGKTAQIIAIESGSKGKVLFLELQLARDSDGDYYRVNSAFPANEKYVQRKAKREGWEPLWSRYPVSSDASGASGFAGETPSAGESAPTVSPQSGDQSLGQIDLAGKEYGKAENNRGSYQPEENLITLLKDADLSTFLHESGHYFFETDIRIAGELISDAQKFGVDTLSDGEKQILADVSALLSWHGINGPVESQVAQWSAMDFEERRAYHERTAESFERYLIEGKAPSIELQSYFNKFKRWLESVYRSVKDFIAKHPESGKLNDEVRQVFDRMLVTEDQIKLAEQARSMIPMFASVEDAAKLGVMIENFATYQALNQEATNAAVDDMQARGVRDMKWLNNARSKILKDLQAQAKSARAEMQIAARRQIMSQPVYQAWQFLTGKVSDNDKMVTPDRPKSDPKVIDETIDNLFVAIGKLGGLNKQEVVETWGVDPADKPQSGVFGKPLWRIDGGLSIDGMAEALGQYGYLTPDEHGKVDVREFEEKFGAQLRGESQYSNAYAPSQFFTGKDGEQIVNPDAVQSGRFSLDALADVGIPVEFVNHLKTLRMTAKDGWHPDLLADRFGFGSGDEMIRTILASSSPKDAIAALTDKMMVQAYSDLATPEAIESAADEAVHNEARMRMVATELSALERAAGSRQTLIAAAKQYAEQVIGRSRVRDLKPAQFASAESRAANAAEAALRAGDLRKAAAEKRNQLVNMHLAKAAFVANNDAESFRRKWSELANRSDDKLKKAYDIDLINVARAILGEYGIAEKRAKRAREYLDAVRRYDAELYAVIEESVDAAQAAAKPFRDMTTDEVRTLADDLGAILHLAKRSHQMEVDGDLMDRQEIEAELLARMQEIGVPENLPGQTQSVTPGEERMIKLKTWRASAVRVESWVDKMDGSNEMGPFRRFVWNQIKDAADAYRSDKAKYLKEFRALFDAIAPTMKPRMIAAPELGYNFGASNGGSGLNEILHAILHTGNESNKRKLLLGRNWATERQDGSLDTSRWDAFVTRMISEGNITKAHYDFVQGVWDLLESIKPLAQKTHRDVFGKYFDEITANEVATPFGVYRGGYVPAMVDSRIVVDAKLRDVTETENQAMAYAFPTTQKGFTKSRVEYNQPLLLDLRTLTQHIDKVLMFAHMEMPVRDVRRVIGRIGETLDKMDPGALVGMLTPWLNRSAKQQVMEPTPNDGGFSRVLSVWRSRAGVAAMFGNLANAFQQVTGFSLAALKVRPSLMLSATADFMKSPKEFNSAVYEASPYMAERLNSEISVMTDDINQILLNPSLIERSQAWTMKHAYFLQNAVDSVMSPIIWTAAYNQALEQKHEHRDAVRLADAAVRQTQGSSLPEDISKIEGGRAWARLFTQFAGYFNMQANLLGTEFAKVMQEYGLRKGAGKGLYIFMFGFFAPAVVGEAVIQLFRGGPGDEDKDGEYLDDWIAALFGWAPLRTLTAMIPVGGTLINSAINAWNSKPYDDRIASSPAISMAESAVKAPVTVYKAIAEDGSKQKAVRDVATLISLSVGVPASAAARPIGYLAGMADNKISPTSTVDMTRGLVTGSASPESKQ